jgi:hypothetical protein
MYNFRCPRVKLKFGDDIITKFVDRDLILYMYDNNFICWDFYMLNYLISFKDVRKQIDQKYLRKFPEVKENKKTVKREKVPAKYYSDDDKSLSFIITLNDRSNTLFKIIPSKLYVNIAHLDLDKWFEFNLKQMKKIDACSSEIFEIEEFFKRVVFLNKDKSITLDFEKLDSITPVMFKCLLMGSRKNENWITSFIQPQIFSYKYTTAKGLKTTDTNLDKAIMDRMQNLDIREWIKIFYEARGVLTGEKKELKSPIKILSPIQRTLRKGSIFSDISKSPVS